MTKPLDLFPGSPADLIIPNRFDHRSRWDKVVDLVVSLFRQVLYSATFLYYWLTLTPQLCGQEINWKAGSRGLVVLLHGLHSDPAA